MKPQEVAGIWKEVYQEQNKYKDKITTIITEMARKVATEHSGMFQILANRLGRTLVMVVNSEEGLNVTPKLYAIYPPKTVQYRDTKELEETMTDVLGELGSEARISIHQFAGMPDVAERINMWNPTKEGVKSA